MVLIPQTEFTQTFKNCYENCHYPLAGLEYKTKQHHKRTRYALDKMHKDFYTSVFKC